MESTPTENMPPRPRRKWLRRVLLLVVVLLGFGVWLDGPGVRVLLPRVGGYFLAKKGFGISFRVEGSLSGGLVLRQVQLRHLLKNQGVDVDFVKVGYEWGEVFGGKVRSVEIRDLAVDWELPERSEPRRDQAVLDVTEVQRLVAAIRLRVLPVELDLKELRVRLQRAGACPFVLGASDLKHVSGSEEMALHLGRARVADRWEWPAQGVIVGWGEDRVSIDQFRMDDGLGIRDAWVQWPVGGTPVGSGELRFEKSVIRADVSVDANRMAIRMDPEGEQLSLAALGERLQVPMPVSANVRDLVVEVKDWYPHWMSAEVRAQGVFEQVGYKNLRLERVSATMDRVGQNLGLKASVVIQGANLATVEATTKMDFSRVKEGDAVEIDGRLYGSQVQGVVDVVKAFAPVVANPMPIPSAEVNARFGMRVLPKRLDVVTLEGTISPYHQEQASEVAVKVRMEQLDRLSGELTVEGARVHGKLGIKNLDYQADLETNGLRTQRLQAWLGGWKLVLPVEIASAGKWQGLGNIRKKQHQGQVELEAVEVQQSGRMPVIASGQARYDWPGGVELDGVVVKQGDHRLDLCGRLKDEQLVLEKADWRVGSDVYVSGSVRVPIPKDFSKWREFVLSDDRQMSLDLSTQELTPKQVAMWWPQVEQLDERSSVQLRLQAKGSLKSPEIALKVQAKQIGVKAKKEIPMVDGVFELQAIGDKIRASGTLTPQQYPGIACLASMPFHVADWIQTPGTILEEPLTAQVTLPNMPVDRFKSFLPMMETLQGNIGGDFSVAGPLRQPQVQGQLSWKNGVLQVRQSKLPAIRDIQVVVKATPDAIVLEQLKASVAGGTMQGSGKCLIEAGAPKALDFKLRASHLPVLRNASLILRSNADLALTGPLDQAKLTGSVSVVDSMYFKDIDILPNRLPISGVSTKDLPKIDSAKLNISQYIPNRLQPWAVDVVFKTENPFLVRGNIATGEAMGRVQLTGTLGAMKPNGIVQLKKARVSLPFSNLRIRSGLLRFTPETGFDPWLEMNGFADPRPYLVNTYVYGNVSNPKFLLSSSPPLPENEIMTLLATGVTTSGLEDPQQASSRAMQLVVEEFRRGRFAGGDKFRPLLGLLDRVDFSLGEKDMYSGETYSSASLKLSRRLELSAGMTQQGDTRVLGKWKLMFR